MKKLLAALLFLLVAVGASSAERVNTGGNAPLNDVATENTACSSTGLIARDTNGRLLFCQSGVWSPSSRASVTYDVVVKKNDTVISKQTITTLDGLPAVLEDAVVVTPYTSAYTATVNTKTKVNETEEVKNTLRTGIEISLVPRIADNKILTGLNFSSSHLNQMNKATVDGHTIEMPDVSRSGFNSEMLLEPNKPVTQQVDAYAIQVSAKIIPGRS